MVLTLPKLMAEPAMGGGASGSATAGPRAAVEHARQVIADVLTSRGIPGLASKTIAGTPPSQALLGRVMMALRDRDAIASGELGISDDARELAEDDLAMLADDTDALLPVVMDGDGDGDRDGDGDGDTGAKVHKLPTKRARLMELVQSCPYTRWRFNLHVIRRCPAHLRDLAEEVERIIVEPIVLWRQMLLSWEQAGTRGVAATAMDTAVATLVVDGDGRKLNPIDIGGPEVIDGQIHLSVHGLPSAAHRYRITMFSQTKLAELVSNTKSGDSAAKSRETDSILLPEFGRISSAAPELIEQLLPRPGRLPMVALPQFDGICTPEANTMAVHWISPALGNVRLCGDEVILVTVLN